MAVKQAFERAEIIQQTVDLGTSPLMKPPGQLVEIEGSQGALSLHTILKGNRVSEKDSIIIFESGLGCFSPDWQFVQDGLPEKSMLSLSYDRSGLGWSENDRTSHTVEQTITNLEALLGKLNLKPPYIFVGHSYGGLVGQLFALKHPDDVHALILVDSSIESIMATNPKGEPASAIDFLPPATFNFNARAGDVSDEKAIAVHLATAKTSHLQTYEEEFERLTKSQESLTAILSQSKPIPIECQLRVITADIYLDLAEDRPLTQTEEQEEKRWKEAQHKLLERGSNSSQIMAHNSDHMIMYHEPEVIVAQIQECFNIS